MVLDSNYHLLYWNCLHLGSQFGISLILNVAFSIRVVLVTLFRLCLRQSLVQVIPQTYQLMTIVLLTGPVLSLSHAHLKRTSVDMRMISTTRLMTLTGSGNLEVPPALILVLRLITPEVINLVRKQNFFYCYLFDPLS